jgi:hypothetical protein
MKLTPEEAEKTKSTFQNKEVNQKQSKTEAIE